jgi:hypothetical protein
MKKTNTPAKGKTNKRADSTTKISTNIGILPSGMYRARKMVNGVCYSQYFTNKRTAQKWINTL